MLTVSSTPSKNQVLVSPTTNERRKTTARNRLHFLSSMREFVTSSWGIYGSFIEELVQRRSKECKFRTKSAEVLCILWSEFKPKFKVSLPSLVRDCWACWAKHAKQQNIVQISAQRFKRVLIAEHSEITQISKNNRFCACCFTSRHLKISTSSLETGLWLTDTQTGLIHFSWS